MFWFGKVRAGVAFVRLPYNSAAYPRENCRAGASLANCLLSHCQLFEMFDLDLTMAVWQIPVRGVLPSDFTTTVRGAAAVVLAADAAACVGDDFLMVPPTAPCTVTSAGSVEAMVIV